MATIGNGILGNIRGKIGSVQGASWKNTYYIQGRITKNGTSTTNKALREKNRFGACRDALSQLRIPHMDYQIAKDSKKLPKWQLWIKHLSKSFRPTYDFWVNSPLVAKGSYFSAPSLLSDFCFVDSGLLFFSVRSLVACDLPNSRINYFLWCRANGRFYFIDGQLAGNFEYLTGNTIWDESMGMEFVFFAYFRDESSNGMVSDSNALRLTAV